MQPMNGSVVVRARAAVSMLFIFETFAVALFLLFLFVGLKRHAGWEGAVVTAGFCLLIFAWWWSFCLVIDKDTLVYKSLFSSRKEIRLSDIAHTVRMVDIISRGTRPPNRIEVYGSINGRPVQFDINMKVFRLEDARKVEAILKPSRG